MIKTKADRMFTVAGVSMAVLSQVEPVLGLIGAVMIAVVMFEAAARKLKVFKDD